MTKKINKNFKFEITQNDDGDYDYLANGGDVLDYLATLSETFVQLCKDNQLPIVPLIKANFHELVNPVSDSIDKLEEYLIAYDEERFKKSEMEKCS